MRGTEFKRVVLVVLIAASVPVIFAKWEERRERGARQALLDALQPVLLSNCTLERVGSAHDGGYLMCANLMAGIQVAYSYGIGPNDDWGCAITRGHSVPVHQYDCFDPARPTCTAGQLIFHDECVADRSQTIGGRVFDTLANQVARNGDTARHKVVKIDVEGAEWDALLQTPDEVLAGIDQMPLELHGTNDSRMLYVVRKLKRTFDIVNLHFNNQACRTDNEPFPASAYQVLLVNKRLGVVDSSSPAPAQQHPLNAPDRPDAPDCQLVSRGR
ncbi:MAG TPA: hypothetical protein VMZ90_08470 [Vicinamibacterales bacterium]|nr:hypothetical protein [Vicinamibacterales bacterium]